jgi:hypothetical protein
MPYATPTKITYRDTPTVSTVVLGGKVVGHIRQLSYGKGWHYAPKGAAGVGATMPTRDAVKRSLEAS